MASIAPSRLLLPRISQVQSCRNKFMFERVIPVPLVKLDKPVSSRKMREKHYIYRVIQDDTTTNIPDIECILTRHVDALGARGQVVTVDREVFRYDLHPSGAAVYASPENLEEYKETDATIIKKTPHALQTYRMLCGMNLPIKMNYRRPWTLSETNIIAAFRQVGVYIESEDCIILPEEPITNQHSEQVPFSIGVKVNGLDEATVSCYIVPFTTNPDKQSELPPSLELPLHRPEEEVAQELRDKNLYSGTTETI